jgi:hypothetical protein
MNNQKTEAAAGSGYAGPAGSTFQHLRLHNPIVAHIMRAGGTAEDCAVALAVHNDRLVDRLMTLEGIAPRKIKLPDGRVMVWRCPDHLIPETDMSNTRVEPVPTREKGLT